MYLILTEYGLYLFHIQLGIKKFWEYNWQVILSFFYYVV